MWIVQTLHYRLATWWHRHRIRHALALQRRGEVRPDGLELASVCSRLDIQWRARDVHPWDCDLPCETTARMFREQSLTDTEAAILRLFNALPQVDVIGVTVLEPTRDTALIVGKVHRSAVNQSRRLLSVRMRLRELGLTYLFPDAETFRGHRRRAS